MMGGEGSTRQTTTYRAFIVPEAPIVAGEPASLDVQIVDQFGKPFTDFETLSFGRFSYKMFFAVASRDLTFMEADPLLLGLGNMMSGAAGAGGMMGSGAADNTGANPLKAPADEGRIKVQVVFPSDGQYIAFLDFRPRGGDTISLAVPIKIGAAGVKTTTLTPDTSFSSTVGNLLVTMHLDGTLKAGQDNSISFTATDSEGQSRNEDIDMFSGYRCNLYVIDEKSTILLRPDLVDRSKLQFLVNFPKPGKYKVWFDYIYENKSEQVSFVLDVK